MNPLIKYSSLGAGGLIVAVAIYFSAITGVNYQGAIHDHLSDIVNGIQTMTVVALNAPNWSIGIPMVTPILTSTATSTGGTLTSSTAYYFAVAALDTNGTTTISNTAQIATDASTTSTTESININWTPVIGATGYAIFFSNSKPALNQYFLATTTATYNFATSSGGIADALDASMTDTHAFSTLLNPTGPDYLNGNNSFATTSIVASTTALQVNGPIDVLSSATTSSCFSSTNGQLFYNTANSHLWLCNGSAWQLVK